MYYYLDKDDGYSKGPYTWASLRQLALLPETYIFEKPHRRWRTFAQLQAELIADTNPKPGQRPRKKQPALITGTATQQTASQPAKHTTPPPQNQLPDFGLPLPPVAGKSVPAMGISGMGCFVAAVLFVLAVIGFLVFVAN